MSENSKRIAELNQLINVIEITIEWHKKKIKELYAEKDKYVEEMEIVGTEIMKKSIESD